MTTEVAGAVASNAELGAADELRASIGERRRVLDMERGEFRRQAMAEYDRAHYLKVKALQDECGQAGHKWRFTHLGPLNDPWFSCTTCRLSECRVERDGA